MNINEQNKKLGGVETEVSNFEKEEPGILQSLNIQIYRNFLLKELDEKDISKVKVQLLKEHKEAEALLEQRRHESDELKNLVAGILGKKEELNNKRIELEVARADIVLYGSRDIRM